MQVNVKYRSWSCQDSQKLQNNASSHYPTTVFAQCIYFLQYETPFFRIHVFRTRRLIHTPRLSWLQNLNFKFGALRREKRRGLAFYTRTSCLSKLRWFSVCKWRGDGGSAHHVNSVNRWIFRRLFPISLCSSFS